MDPLVDVSFTLAGTVDKTTGSPRRSMRQSGNSTFPLRRLALVGARVLEIQPASGQSPLQSGSLDSGVREPAGVNVDTPGLAQVDEGPVIGDFIGQVLMHRPRALRSAAEHAVATVDGDIYQ
jgi:hypothetical protein